MTLIRCNLCGQDFDAVTDDDLRKRLMRHKEHHNPVGRTASSNIIRGDVHYILEDWENEND
jgi:hypothetical protein